MLSLLRRRPAFRRFWLAELVSQLGDWLSYVAVSLLALAEGPGEGALAVALVLVVHQVPAVLLAPAAGVLADRFDRRLVLSLSHAGAGLATLGMLAGAVHGSLLAVEALLVVRALAAALAGPARTAVTARLVRADELEQANALEAATWSAMFAGGMALGGVLASVGVAWALALDAATFFVATALTLGLPALRVRSVRRSSLRDAIGLVRRDPELLRAVLAKVPLALAGGGAWVVLHVGVELAPFAGTAALTLALLQGVKGLGTGVGPLMRRHELLEAVGFGGIALFLFSGSPAVLVLASLMWGVGSGANWVRGQIALQRAADDETLGRMSSLDVVLFTSGMSLTAVLTGGAIELGVAPALAAAPFLVAGLSLRAAVARRARPRPAGSTPNTAGSW